MLLTVPSRLPWRTFRTPLANGTPPGLTRELSERVAPGTDAGRERPTVPSVPVVEPEIEPVTVFAGRGL